MSERVSRTITPRVREGTLSKNTSAYSESRHRLPIEVVEKFTDSVAQTIIDRCPETVDDRQAFIIDGTTFKLPPPSNLREVDSVRENVFRKRRNVTPRDGKGSISPNKKTPAENQFGETVWPILMLTVAHELRSGAALRPEFGAMYGGKNTSEARQAIAIAKRIPAESLVLADTGYGI